MVSGKIEDALGAFVRSKQKGMDSGNYQAMHDASSESGSLGSLIAKNPLRPSTIEVSHMRQYARRLKERVDEGASLARQRTPTGTISPPSLAGVSTRNSSLRTQRGHGERKRNSRTSALEVIASSSGVEPTGKHSSPISTSERTRLSTSDR